MNQFLIAWELVELEQPQGKELQRETWHAHALLNSKLGCLFGVGMLTARGALWYLNGKVLDLLDSLQYTHVTPHMLSCSVLASVFYVLKSISFSISFSRGLKSRKLTSPLGTQCLQKYTSHRHYGGIFSQTLNREGRKPSTLSILTQ